MTERGKYLRVRDVAKELGISRSRAYALVRAHRIPAIREGRSLRIPAAAFERWMEARVRAALAAVESTGEQERSGSR